ncbi:hypothetical protein V1511DRAFT_502010 [Dipodascopsis uninucleata]
MRNCIISLILFDLLTHHFKSPQGYAIQCIFVISPCIYMKLLHFLLLSRTLALHTCLLKHLIGTIVHLLSIANLSPCYYLSPLSTFICGMSRRAGFNVSRDNIKILSRLKKKGTILEKES